MPRTAPVVICGAGIAGAAAAWALAVEHGWRDIVLVDERPPLSLTSDKSTEAYRNWWPGPDDAMLRFMNRSIDRLEEIARATGNRIHLDRRGYLYATADPAHAAGWLETGRQAERWGAGPLRVHRGAGADEPQALVPGRSWDDVPDGADLLLDPGLVQKHFPYLSRATIAVLHPRRCGWFSGQQLGMYFLEEAAARGAVVQRGRVTGVELQGGKVSGVEVATPGGTETIATERFVVAAGPFAARVAALVGVELPIHCELHRKMALEDRHRVVPRHAPLVIWDDPQFLPWSEAERRSLDTAPEMHHLLRRFPAGAHFRPEGGPDAQTLLLLWAYDVEPVAPRLPLPEAPDFPEIVLRGLCTPVPGFATYLEPLQGGFVDGGYYTKTRENRPLIGPLPVEGAFVFAALSGYGLMAACAGGELLAAHLAGTQLPPWADAFRLERYDDPKYRAQLENWGDTGQL